MASSDPTVNGDGDTSTRVKKVTDRFSESLHILANEPSLGVFRLQEHIRRTLPNLIEVKCEVVALEDRIEGKCFDVNYAAQTVEDINVIKTFLSLQQLAKRAQEYTLSLKKQ